MRSRAKRKIYAVESAYLDPLDCDSTISYKVGKGTRIYGSIQLADCQRKIEWWFNRDSGSEKIDNVIAILTRFKEAFNEAKKIRTPVRKRRK